MTTATISGAARRAADEDGDRFIEIWNNVFMQNEQFADGRLEPLEMQSIDTGMGLERIGALLQGKHDNYDTDLMRSLIEAAPMPPAPTLTAPARSITGLSPTTCAPHLS
jgi:alanyl-tRNA synthetase